MAGEREALMSSVPHVSSTHVLCISNSHVSAGGHEVWSHPSTVRKGMGRRRMDSYPDSKRTSSRHNYRDKFPR